MNNRLNELYAAYDFPPVMSREEEMSFGEKLSSEDEDEKTKAQEEFINRNLRLVVKIAAGYERCGLELDDMVCEGNMGLMEAAKRYDPSVGAKFSTYASYWIRQKITRALCNHGRLIRLPVQLVQLQLKVIKYIDKNSRSNNDDPSYKKIAKDLGEPVHLVKKVMDSKFFYSSIDASLESDPNGTRVDGGKMSQQVHANFGSVLKDEKADNPLDSLVKNDNKAVINKHLNKLKERERYVIEHRFGLNNKDVKTLEKIGEEFNVTRERIRQVEFETMKKLRFAIQKDYR